VISVKKWKICYNQPQETTHKPPMAFRRLSATGMGPDSHPGGTFLETEMKLRFLREDGSQLLANDAWLQSLIMPESTITKEMFSIYFDTVNHDLQTINASLRVRTEGDLRVITIKRSDGFAGPRNGLHQRMEWSVNLDDDIDLESFFKEGLDINWFLRCAVSEGDPDDALQAALGLLKGKKLVEICRANFTRSSVDVGYGDTLMELSVDIGELLVGEQREDIREIELELKEGDTRDLVALGNELASRLMLEPEPRSKYGRCLAMLKHG
jgi:triphosphatase